MERGLPGAVGGVDERKIRMGNNPQCYQIPLVGFRLQSFLASINILYKYYTIYK